MPGDDQLQQSMPDDDPARVTPSAACSISHGCAIDDLSRDSHEVGVACS